jgi:polysaccharide biosynthesis/export protein
MSRSRGPAGVAVLIALVMLAGCANVQWPSLPTFVRGVEQPPAASATASTVGAAQWGDPPGGVRSRAGGGAAPTSVVTDPSYEIGPEDALEISVWKDESLKAATLVRPDGGISFPLIGEVMVAGKTAAQVRDEVTRRLDKYVPEPVVNVAVVRVASYRVYVLGRVNKPGEYPLGRTVNVLQALSLAGGVTPFAVEEGIRIIRKVGSESVSIPFDYSRVLRGGDMSQNIMLKSGDVVLVP